MDILDILLYFIIFYLGIWFGETLTTLRIRYLISKLELGETHTSGEPEIKKLITEQINGVLYLYNTDTKDFICQGSSIEELAKIAKEYKNINSAAVIHNDKLFFFKNGTCKEHTF